MLEWLLLPYVENGKVRFIIWCLTPQYPTQKQRWHEWNMQIMGFWIWLYLGSKVSSWRQEVRLLASIGWSVSVKLVFHEDLDYPFTFFLSSWTVFHDFFVSWAFCFEWIWRGVVRKTCCKVFSVYCLPLTILVYVCCRLYLEKWRNSGARGETMTIRTSVNL